MIKRRIKEKEDKKSEISEGEREIQSKWMIGNRKYRKKEEKDNTTKN